MICSKYSQSIWKTSQYHADYLDVVYRQGLNCFDHFILPILSIKEALNSYPKKKNWHVYTIIICCIYTCIFYFVKCVLADV